MKKIIIRENEAGQRVDKYLQKILPGMTKSLLYKMLRKKNIHLNKNKIEGSEKLEVGDALELYFSDETYAIFSQKAEKLERAAETSAQVLPRFTVVYEDQNLLVVNKPGGVLSQREGDEPSLVEAIEDYLKKQGVDMSQGFRVGICNRLDRNTSGLVISAKSTRMLQSLNDMLAAHQVKKYYHCVVVGVIDKPLVLEGHLKKDNTLNKVTLSDKGQEIKTKVNPIKNNGHYTLCEVELITGKTHQIRAHLASIGHPIIGDMKYGDARYNERMYREYRVKYPMLHAYQLTFFGKEEILSPYYTMNFTAQYPKTFERAIELIFEKSKSRKLDS